MKKTTILLAATLVSASTFSTQAFAVDGLSANVAATNNYVWRGVSQTNNGAAVSGGIDYNAKSGFYASTWISNVDYGDDTTSELDIILGYGFEIEDFAFDISYLNYAYPGGDDLNFSEVALSVKWEIFKVGYNVLANSDYGSDFGDDDYLYVDIGFELARDLKLSFHYGVSSYNAGGDYNDYGISLSKNDFTFALIKNDKDDSDLAATITYSVSFDL